MHAPQLQAVPITCLQPNIQPAFCSLACISDQPACLHAANVHGCASAPSGTRCRAMGAHMEVGEEDKGTAAQHKGPVALPASSPCPRREAPVTRAGLGRRRWRARPHELALAPWVLTESLLQTRTGVSQHHHHLAASYTPLHILCTSTHTCPGNMATRYSIHMLVCTQANAAAST